jgi:3-oxoacyl-[acyl-carrier-protein] synthase II
MMRRVVVTGMGAITSVGNTAPQSWCALLNGESGIGDITHFDTTHFDVKIAGEIKDWNSMSSASTKLARRLDRYQLLIYAAMQQAVEQAEVTIATETQRLRTGVIIGSSIGGMTSFSEQLHNIHQHGPRRMSPFGIPSFMTTTGSSLSSIELGVNGPSYIITSACATGGDCIGHAFDQIRLGRMDVMVAGAGEAPILPNAIAGFDRLGACSHEVEKPQMAMRPFDVARTGLVVAEGAAVLVLEELEHAQQRGAAILGEVVGYGASSDAYHMVAPHPDGRGAAIAIQRALDDAKLTTEQIDYINAHGTATPLNDGMETLAIKHVFGEAAYNIPVSSTKSMTGHAMGATAAMEAIFSVMALQEQAIPPTINLETPDPACDLDYVPNEAREAALSYVMSNAFGFGGHNAVLVFKRF